MTDADLHWLAGLLEGEGSFMLASSKKADRRYFYPRIVVNMTDLDVMERAAHLLGCKLQALPLMPGRKQAYRAQRWGSAAAKLMLELRPLMGERRRRQIDRALALPS